MKWHCLFYPACFAAELLLTPCEIFEQELNAVTRLLSNTSVTVVHATSLCVVCFVFSRSTGRHSLIAGGYSGQTQKPTGQSENITFRLLGED